MIAIIRGGVHLLDEDLTVLPVPASSPILIRPAKTKGEIGAPGAKQVIEGTLQ